jgi:hypothetical protein
MNTNKTIVDHIGTDEHVENAEPRITDLFRYLKPGERLTIGMVDTDNGAYMISVGWNNETVHQWPVEVHINVYLSRPELGNEGCVMRLLRWFIPAGQFYSATIAEVFAATELVLTAPARLFKETVADWLRACQRRPASAPAPAPAPVETIEASIVYQKTSTVAGRVTAPLEIRFANPGIFVANKTFCSFVRFVDCTQNQEILIRGNNTFEGRVEFINVKVPPKDQLHSTARSGNRRI